MTVIVWLFAPSVASAQQPSGGSTARAPTSDTVAKTPFEVVRDINRAGGPWKTRIIDGKDADYSQNKWQVALVISEFPNNFRAQFCGGSYLGGKWVVTAAHCVDQDITLFAVFFGSGKLDTSGSRVTIVNKFVHKSYSRYGVGYDIALLELQAPLPVQSITPVTAAEASTMKSGDLVRVTGWGVINDVGVNSQALQQVSLPLQTPKTCNASDAYNGTVSPDMMCAGKDSGDQDTCNGDSGGPASLAFNGTRKLVGIVSSGDKNCAQPKRYSIYTRVGSYADWIKTTVDAAEKASP